MTQDAKSSNDTTLVIAGTYLLHAVVGKGSMSVVHKGVNLGTGDQVAVKIMRKNLLKDDEMVARFQREIKTCTSLEHKNIIKVYDGGLLSTGEPFLVMELLQGTTIAEILKESKTIPLDRSINLICQAAEALAFSHSRGYVHRDIKPQNIMVGKKDHVKVLDFGVAKVAGALREADMFSTSPGQVLGTPQYMSPEQIRGESLDGRSDIYALACVLYECLSGTAPIAGDNAIAVMRKHLADPPPHLNSASPQRYPEEVNDVLQKALSKLAVDRFTTMTQFAEVLRSMAKKCAGPGRITQGIIRLIRPKE